LLVDAGTGKFAGRRGAYPRRQARR